MQTNPFYKFNYLFFLLAMPAVFISCNDAEKPTGQKKTEISIDTLHKKESVNPYITYDQSPMDMSYYPPDYPILKMNGSDTSSLVARVIYSRPQKKGRLIFGPPGKGLREYGKEWRLGANEATEIEFFKDVMVGKSNISRGRYIIYCIPYADKWTIVLNNNLFTWGLHLDTSRDVFKTDISTTIQNPPLEDFTMVFVPANNGTNLIMAWDDVRVSLPIKVKP